MKVSYSDLSFSIYLKNKTISFHLSLSNKISVNIFFWFKTAPFPAKKVWMDYFQKEFFWD